MRKIITSLLVVGVVTAAGIGASQAFFSDTETSNTNAFTAGTLRIDVNDNGSIGTFPMNLGTITDMMPGSETSEVSLEIKNTGDSDLAWFGYFNASSVLGQLDKAIYIKSAKMEFLSPAGAIWEPADHFILNGTGNSQAYYTNLANTGDYGLISINRFNRPDNNMMGAGHGVFEGALKPGFRYKLTFQLGMAPLAGDIHQNGSMNLTFTVKATQINAEAIDTVFANSRFAGSSTGADHLSWLNLQIGKQTMP